jgi:hypothetical protein
MPSRIAALPVSERGYPVPFFVAWLDGKPEFRAADPEKKKRCIKESLCWVCGQRLGKFKCFVIGPMCVVNRNTAEPPCHLDCAEWSLQACPFLVNPNMSRRENNLPENIREAAGVAIKRNPGVVANYMCGKYKLNFVENGVLFALGEPFTITWWCEGRNATRVEVIEAMDSGIPILIEACKGNLEDTKALEVLTLAAKRYVPLI